MQLPAMCSHMSGNEKACVDTREEEIGRDLPVEEELLYE